MSATVANVLTIDTVTYSGRGISRLAAIAANSSVVIGPTGTGYISANMPDGSPTYGNQRGDYSVDLQLSRSSAFRVASGSYSSIVGGLNNGSAGNYNVVGGSGNVSAGSYNLIGGNTNSGTGSYGGIFGDNNLGSGDYTLTSGKYAVGSLYGQRAHAAGFFAAAGDAQVSTLVARRATAADTTPVNLFLEGSSSRITIPANTTWLAVISIIARTTTAGAAYASFVRQCIVHRGVAVGTTVVSTAITIGTDQGSNATLPPTGWAVAIAADATNGALDIQCTGSATAAARWVARIDLTEVAYA